MTSHHQTRATPDPVYILRGANTPVICLFYPQNSNNLLFSGGIDGVVCQWDLTRKRIESKLDGHNGRSVLWITSVHDDTLITQGRDGQIQFWSEKNACWEKTGTLPCSTLNFCPGCLIKDSTSTLIIVPSDITSQVDIFDYRTHSLISSLKPNDEKSQFGMCMNIHSAQQNTATPEILVGYENGTIALWDIRNRQIINELKPHEESIMCMAYSLTLNKGISAASGDIITSWEISTDRKLTQLASLSITNPGFSDVKIRSDDKIFATAGWDSNVRIFGLKKLRPLAVLSFHKQTVQGLAFSSDKTLACGSKDQLISLWEIYK